MPLCTLLNLNNQILRRNVAIDNIALYKFLPQLLSTLFNQMTIL